MTDWLETIVKALVYGSALTAVGAVTLRHGLLRLAGHRLSAEVGQAVVHDSVTCLRWASAGLLVALTLRAWAHTATAFGVADAFSLENLRIIAVESRWAGGWHLQVASALALCLGAVLAARDSPLAQNVCIPAVLLVCAALPQTGHPAGHPWRECLHALHVAAGGAWLGTLLVTVRTVRAARSALLQAFAPIAMSAVAIVGLAGMAMSVLYVGSLDSLFTSLYGRVLLAKAASVGVALTMGALNWRHFRRAETALGTLPAIEASVLLLVVALTAWLTETAHP